MIGFFFKKSFFDFWDNLYFCLLLNIPYLVAVGLLILLPLSLQFPTGIFLVFLAVFLLFASLYSGVVSRFTERLVHYEKPTRKDFIVFLKETWKTSVLHFLVQTLFLGLAGFAFVFYVRTPLTMGFLLMAILIGFLFVFLLTFQFFFAAQSQLDKRFPRILKKSFVLNIDNQGFSILVFLISAPVYLVSIFLGFLLPGPSAVLLLLNVAVKLRSLKYDYIEEHPDSSRKNIPWTILLMDDKERIGNRSLKNLIFPWKY